MIEEIISALALFIALAFINVSVIYIYRRKIKWFFNEVYNKALKSSTPLQKEIKAEWKEIAELRQHKRDMEELEELKRQKEQLWEDVHEEEHPKFKGVDPLPHLKSLQTHPNNIVEECPHCQGDNFWLEYTKDKLIQSCKECDAPVAFIKPSKHFEEITREVEGEIEERLTIIEKYESGE